MRRTMSLRRVVVIGLLLSAMLAAFAWWREQENIDALLQQAQRAFVRENYAEAERIMRRLLAEDAENIRGWLLQARTQRAQGRWDSALASYDRISDDGTTIALAARCEAGDLLLFQLRKLTAAEEQFRRAVAQDPHSGTANNRLAFLLGMQTRQWASIPFRLAMIRLNAFDLGHLAALCRGDHLPQEEELRAFHAADSDNAGVLLALGRVALASQNRQQAEQFLERAVRAAPQLIEAQLAWGDLLIDAGRHDEFVTWYARLPSEAWQHPGIWVVAGRKAARDGDHRAAARCFWEAVRRDAAHREANYQLGQALTALGDADRATPFLGRAQNLQKYADLAQTAWNTEQPATMQQTGRLAEQLGLLWEAYAWARIALQRDPRQRWAQRLLARCQPELAQQPLERTAAAANPARQIDLSAFPLPDWSPDGSSRRADPTPRTASVAVGFEDQASQTGLRFVYRNGGRPLTDGQQRMYEVMGGGAAALDYDGDGWPDVYLTQGGDAPPDSGEQEYSDRLFRNDGGFRFVDTTAEAGIAETSFSQGVAVGDIDNDGFPDLYVANVGRNRLYHNNGDGTFSDITAFSGATGRRWTTSCAMADLNLDGNPDIYAVNYLTGKDVFTRICTSSRGVPLSCFPQYFPAAQDQLFLSLGDGRFECVTSEAGIVHPDGRGLGIVVGNFDQTRGLDVFVANDVGRNFLFSNRTPRAGGRPVFQERGLEAGVGLNAAGEFEASMGVAAGDSDGNGLIDLFVTNFEDETNTLYRQRALGQFVDATRAAGLDAPSLRWLGFGTQFLDGELDGDLDLLVANGHINDYRETDRPYAMPPQYFENLGDGRFIEVEPEHLGPYFASAHLGRALARLDWNRDGREDAIIQHLGTPAALLTNLARRHGNWLAVRFCGVDSDRDAIGATVQIKAGHDTVVRQLTAGDGFHASNERILTFGLGSATVVDEMRITWPSGRDQVYRNLTGNQMVVCIEGAPAILSVHSGSSR